MTPRPRTETPIERIYREVTGSKMPLSIKLILLPKRKGALNSSWFSEGIAELEMIVNALFISNEKHSAGLPMCSRSVLGNCCQVKGNGLWRRTWLGL